MPRFSHCGELYQNGSSLTPNPYAQWAYHGPIRGVLRATDRPFLITLEGCLAVCGAGYEPYGWLEASNTITTWVLPVIGGLLLQAPYESNRFWATFFALIRWIGSPMSSLAYVLWNIKVTGKCALMVDMAVPFDRVPLGEDSGFSRLRDSFYILAVMNQYQIKSRMPEIGAEKLLRIALFSDSLKLTHDEHEGRSLPELRQALADHLRRGRRRGTVPVFISIGWFLFSLGISIESAFGNLGHNTTAHNLAMGLMLGWIPVFILGSIVDRNPVSSDDIRHRLNELLESVRRALLDPNLRHTYIKDTGGASDDYQWTQALHNDEHFSASFFSHFAGQGRTRWHYGVAHLILAGIEKAYVAQHGRDWLRDSERARTAMVLGPEQLTGLRWFDWREVWQIFSAVAVVTGTITGSIIISYWTPTVGLGCRSGGYMIFIIIAFSSLSIEMLVWWLTPTKAGEALEWLPKPAGGDPLVRLESRIGRTLSRSQSRPLQASLLMKIQAWMRAWEDLQFRPKIEILVLRPLDLINTVWLVYIVNAQTFGWYRSCVCMSSVWAAGGGYVDFESIESYKAHGISLYWVSGTALSLVILATAILFIIAEWCSQSYLSTADYAAASRGLKRTRLWKLRTVWLRKAPNAVIEGMVSASWAISALVRKRKRIRHGRRSLVWSPGVKNRRRPPPIITHGGCVSETGDGENVGLLSAGRGHSDKISLPRIERPAAGHLRTSPSGSTAES